MIERESNVWGIMAASMVVIVVGLGGTMLGHAIGYAAAADKATPLLHKTTEMIVDCRRRLGDQSD